MTFTILPFLVALVINFISPENLKSRQQADNDPWYEKWLRKAETMPKPLRYIPGFQTAYHVCVVVRMSQYTFEISGVKSLQKELEEKIETDSIKAIPEDFNEEQSTYDTFRKELGEQFESYLEVEWNYQDDKDEYIQQIKSKLEKKIVDSQKDMSKLQSNFLRAKIYEAFLESSPQFCLQLYIIVSAGYLAGWQQLLTIITSFASVVMVSMTIYLKMPLASGEFPYQHWKDLIFIFPTMLTIVIPRLVGLVIVASMFKHWFFAIVLVGLCNFLVYWKSVKKSPEDSLLGLYVSWVSSCVIKTKLNNFLVTSAMLPTISLLIITNVAWLCVSFQIQPMSGLFEDNHPIYLCLPQSKYPQYNDVFKNLTSIVRCQISPTFDTNCSDTLFHQDSDSKNEAIYGTFCPKFINQSGFLPEMTTIMAVLVVGLVLGILATIFLTWYILPVNRYVLSYHFPLIDPNWNPDHAILEDVVKQLYVSHDGKNPEIMYQELNKKIVKDSKKTILQVATKFGLMKLVKTAIDEFDAIEIEKLFIRNSDLDSDSDSDPEHDAKMSFLGIACRTGNIETIKWIVSCMNKKPIGKKDSESQEKPLLQAGYDLFFKGIGLENEIPPITVATNPALDFLLHEGNYFFQNHWKSKSHFLVTFPFHLKKVCFILR